MMFQRVFGSGLNIYQPQSKSEGARQKAGDAGHAKKLAAKAMATVTKRAGSEALAGELDRKQQSLSRELKKALSLDKLKGPVEFNLDSKGKLSVKGSDQDSKAIAKLFADDRSNPSLRQRLTELLSEANAVGDNFRQLAAISQAAGAGRLAGDVTRLYKSFLQGQPAVPASLTITASSSSLEYSGRLNASA